MVHNLSPSPSTALLCHGAWNSIAANPDTSVDRCNFMFAAKL